MTPIRQANHLSDLLHIGSIIQKAQQSYGYIGSVLIEGEMCQSCVCVFGRSWRCPHFSILSFVLSLPLLPFKLLFITHSVHTVLIYHSYLTQYYFFSSPPSNAVRTDKTFVSLSGVRSFLFAYFLLCEMAQFHIEIEMFGFIFYRNMICELIRINGRNT